MMNAHHPNHFAINNDTDNNGVHVEYDAKNDAGNTRAEARYELEQFRERLRYFFMNPYQKYRRKRRMPVKFVCQVFKLIFVTLQTALFAYNAATHVQFQEENTLAFKHIFLKGWDPAYETLPYPPATGVYAIYTYDALYDYVTHAINQMRNVSTQALGSYDFPAKDRFHARLCSNFYRNSWIDASTNSYQLTNQLMLECVSIDSLVLMPNLTRDELKRFLELRNFQMNFDNVLYVDVNFGLSAVQLKPLEVGSKSECYYFNITIMFDNSKHDGKIPVTLTTRMIHQSCNGTVIAGDSLRIKRYFIIGLDAFVLLLCLISVLLCLNSIFKSFVFYREINDFFQVYYHHRVREHHAEFWKLWYWLIVLNDLLLIIGTIMKLCINFRIFVEYAVCSNLLGLGVFFVWIGFLRYFEFFTQYSHLINTIKRCTITLLRFALCTFILYIGFALFGWVVLGAYHLKFSSFTSTCDCMFALMNGDEIYVTFSDLSKTNLYVAIFGRVYLYLFNIIFIYVVVNMVLNIILDAYEYVKEQTCCRGRPRSGVAASRLLPPRHLQQRQQQEQQQQEKQHRRDRILRSKSSGPAMTAVWGGSSLASDADLSIHRESGGAKKRSCRMGLRQTSLFNQFLYEDEIPAIVTYEAGQTDGEDYDDMTPLNSNVISNRRKNNKTNDDDHQARQHNISVAEGYEAGSEHNHLSSSGPAKLQSHKKWSQRFSGIRRHFGIGGCVRGGAYGRRLFSRFCRSDRNKNVSNKCHNNGGMHDPDVNMDANADDDELIENVCAHSVASNATTASSFHPHNPILQQRVSTVHQDAVVACSADSFEAESPPKNKQDSLENFADNPPSIALKSTENHENVDVDRETSDLQNKSNSSGNGVHAAATKQLLNASDAVSTSRASFVSPDSNASSAVAVLHSEESQSMPSFQPPSNC